MKGLRAKDGKIDKKLSVKSQGKKPATKKGKAAEKDTNKPKRPASAFFVFMEDFRKTYKEKHPENKSVAAVSKAGGNKWKSMSDAEKAPYQAKADKRKTEYNKNLESYNKKPTEAPAAPPAESEESEKSKSEVEDDDEDQSGEDDNEDDDE